MKKTLSIILSIILILTIVPFSGMADDLPPEDLTENDFGYALLDDGTAKILYYLGKDVDLIVPDTLGGKTVTAIGAMAFEGSGSTKTILLNAGMTDIDERAFRYARFESISVSDANTTFSSIDGVLFSKDKSLLIKYPESGTRTSYTIPNGVKIIGKGAFIEVRQLEAVTFSDGVSEISEDAFCYNEALAKISLPAGLKTVGRRAFFDCRALTDITVPAGVTSIGENALGFTGNDSAELVPDFTLRGKDGSTASNYAADNDIRFIPCEHTYVESVKTPATCTEAGVNVFTCSSCFDSYETATEATGHTVVTDKAKSATCTETGLSAGSHCSVCGEVIVPQKVTLKRRHTNRRATTKKATYFEEGVSQQKCTACGRLGGQKRKIKKKRLGKPVLKVCVAGSKKLTVSYNRVRYAKGYQIYLKKGTGSWTKQGNTRKLNYAVKNLSAGSKYSVKVRAFITQKSKVAYSPFSESGTGYPRK